MAQPKVMFVKAEPFGVHRMVSVTARPWAPEPSPYKTVKRHSPLDVGLVQVVHLRQ